MRFTLPEVDTEQDELATDFLDNDLDNTALVGINAAPMIDFTKEMAQEEGVDHDLELELENLAFLKENRPKCDKNLKKDKKDDNQKQDGTLRKQGNKSSVMPHMTRKPKPVRNSATSAMTSSLSTPGSPKGVWKTMKHGIRKKYRPSHPQNYSCKVCRQLLPSRGELNEHHRRNHPPVLCPVCKKSFSSPNTRDRHLYSHNLNKQFSCYKYEESFAFGSELTAHKIVHRTIRTWICTKKGCDRDFKRKGDLVAHAKTHTGQVFVCTVCKNFSTKVKKNLQQHLRCHTKELKYKCRICGKGFVWTQQVKRHIERDHT